MSYYPSVSSDSCVDAGTLLARVTAIFEDCGMEPRDATLLADSLVMADLRGVHSHGILRVPEYVKKLTRDGVNPKGRPAVVKRRGAAMVVDGNNAMGQIACAVAMDHAISTASELGLAAVAIRGSNHCGALFHTAMKALDRNMIGIVGTNALPTMAPWGGCDKILGINPLGVAIPAKEEPPIILDAAFSASSHGKIRIYHQKGLSIPEGWAFDRNGAPTTDAGAAILGLLQPIGEFKGTGLAIVVGILSSLLSGAAFGTELGNMESGPEPGRDGQFVMAIDVDFFEDGPVFRSRVDHIIRQIRASSPAPGFERCYAPGEIEYETERRYRQEGIPLNAESLAGLEQAEKDAARF